MRQRRGVGIYVGWENQKGVKATSKFLRVNMTTGEVKFEEVPERYMMLGGRALTSQLVLDKVSPTRHPFGPYNKLAIAPGLLSGTNTPPSGRLSVGGKGPLTGGIKEINASVLPLRS